MKPVDVSGCKTHIFVCTNERPEGKSCCKRVGGDVLFQTLKQRVRGSSLSGSCFVTRTGCLGYCNDVGSTVKIQSQGEEDRWFTEVVASDLDSLWEQIVRE